MGIPPNAAANQASRMADRRGAREIRDLLVFQGRFHVDVLHQPAQAGAQDDPRLGAVGPPLRDRRRGFLNLVVEIEHHSALGHEKGVGNSVTRPGGPDKIAVNRSCFPNAVSAIGGPLGENEFLGDGGPMSFFILLLRKPLFALVMLAATVGAAYLGVTSYLQPVLVENVQRPIYTVGDAMYVRALLDGKRVVKLGPLPGNFLYGGGMAFEDPAAAVEYLRHQGLTGLGWGVFELNGDFDCETHSVSGEARISRTMFVTRQVYPTVQVSNLPRRSAR